MFNYCSKFYALRSVLFEWADNISLVLLHGQGLLGAQPGQINKESAALAKCALDPNVAVIHPDNLTADVKSQAGATDGSGH